MFNGMRYTIKQAFSQVLRNRTMSIASIFSITAMLLILGLFFYTDSKYKYGCGGGKK